MESRARVDCWSPEEGDMFLVPPPERRKSVVPVLEAQEYLGKGYGGFRGAGHVAAKAELFKIYKNNSGV